MGKQQTYAACCSQRARLDGPGAPAGGSLSSLAPNATCPITLKPLLKLKDPVKDATGVVYERAAVTWFLHALPARKRGRGITMAGSTHEVTLAELVPAGEVVQAKRQAKKAKRQAAEDKQRLEQAQQAQQQAQVQQQPQQHAQQQPVDSQVVDLTADSPRSLLANPAAAEHGPAKILRPTQHLFGQQTWVLAAMAASGALRTQPKAPSPMPDLAKVRGTRLTVHFGQCQAGQA
ncbi:hypothetical protein COHA_010469 [Chlorella ohadii]|uniref:U-box domain-containing protein n=1 Tax=Chlorella ohadii TaxID=2649997 RepID=A0AAD5GZM5_9CHLO|nr:hypothetical protein COHA_010469 [Chlorella ohadii]